jgi:Mrp family chromosome partitioning ATPase
VLGSIGDDVDLVILDSPPVLAVSDPLVLASIVDGVILVASASSTDTRQVTRAVDRLLAVDAPVLGTVLNQFDPKDGESYVYGYTQPTAATAAGHSEPIEEASGEVGDPVHASQ